MKETMTQMWHDVKKEPPVDNGGLTRHQLARSGLAKGTQALEVMAQLGAWDAMARGQLENYASDFRDYNRAMSLMVQNLELTVNELKRRCK